MDVYWGLYVNLLLICQALFVESLMNQVLN